MVCLSGELNRFNMCFHMPGLNFQLKVLYSDEFNRKEFKLAFRNYQHYAVELMRHTLKIAFKVV